jgi:hypothetical protein
MASGTSCKALGHDPAIWLLLRALEKGKGVEGGRRGPGRPPDSPRQCANNLGPKLCTLIEYEEKNNIYEKEIPWTQGAARQKEEISMTQEEPTMQNEEIVAHVEEAHYVEPGTCIADSGCTSTVMGEEIWKEWIPFLKKKNLITQLFYETGGRQFKFGNGNAFKSTRRVRLPVKFYGEDKDLEISLVPEALHCCWQRRRCQNGELYKTSGTPRSCWSLEKANLGSQLESENKVIFYLIYLADFQIRR